MKSLLGVAATALLASSVSASEAPHTLAEAKSLAASQNKPLLIDFYAVW
jgi:hypothetical protein